jgi:transposase-like protein
MEFDQADVVQALRDADGNVSEAAKTLGCSRRTLQNRMRTYGIPEGRSGRRKRKLNYRKRASAAAGVGVAAAAVGAILLGRHVKNNA